jgi:hypothetical protein
LSSPARMAVSIKPYNVTVTSSRCPHAPIPLSPFDLANWLRAGGAFNSLPSHAGWLAPSRLLFQPWVELQRQHPHTARPPPSRCRSVSNAARTRHAISGVADRLYLITQQAGHPDPVGRRSRPDFGQAIRHG